MTKWIKKIWNDPVGSKVIASILMIIIVAVVGAIKTHYQWAGFVSLLTINIPLWILLLGLALYGLVVYVVGKCRTPRFTDFVCIDNLYDFSWSWKWKFDKTSKRYKIIDLKPICRTCGERMHLESIYSKRYICPNDHTYPSTDIKWGLAMNTIQDKVYELYTKDANKYFERTEVL